MQAERSDAPESKQDTRADKSYWLVHQEKNRPEISARSAADAQRTAKDLGLPDTKISSDWTVAIDMRADRSMGPPTQDKAEKLKLLAEKTKNSSVSLVVQVATAGASLTHAEYQAGRRPIDKLERYIIRDGTVTKIYDGESKGVAQDEKELLHSAITEAPSQKLGLIIGAHGGSDAGITGYGGRASLDELHKAISDGLKADGKTKLDVLDFDACNMGNAKVLDKLGDLSDNIVASTQPELTDLQSKQFNGQNLKASLDNLIANPQMDGKQFAASFVEEAKAGANDGDPAKTQDGRSTGTKTLSAYDTTKFAAFKTQLNNLGRALLDVEKDLDKKRILQDALSQVPTIEDERDHRDFKLYADALLKKIADGELQDASGRLKKQIYDALESEAALVADYHGADSEGCRNWGALSVFLPDRTQPKNTFGQLSPTGELLPMEPVKLNEKRKQELAAASMSNALDGTPDWNLFADSL